MPDANITSKEYQQFLAERDRIAQAMQDAESEFMFQTYKKLYAVLNKRYDAAVKLNISLENKQISEMAEQKRKSFDAAKSNNL